MAVLLGLMFKFAQKARDKMTGSNPSSTPRPSALEKIPAAAHRMGCSTSQTYREIKAGRLGPLVKLGTRASAVPAESVDSWIAARIAEAKAVQS